MQLGSVIEVLRTLDEGLCIVAKRPWSAQSEARLVRLTDELRVPQSALDAGYEYFLEVAVARDEVLSGLDFLTREQSFDAVLYYAEHDAFPVWLHELCRAR